MGEGMGRRRRKHKNKINVVFMGTGGNGKWEKRKEWKIGGRKWIGKYLQFWEWQTTKIGIRKYLWAHFMTLHLIGKPINFISNKNCLPHSMWPIPFHQCIIPPSRLSLIPS
jgi:hypothetical protein